VIGVLPADVGFPHKSDLAHGNGHIQTTDVWLPSALSPEQNADREDFGGVAIARLKPGRTLEQGQTEMSTVMSRLDKIEDATVTLRWHSGQEGWRYIETLRKLEVCEWLYRR
jgi:hypothetical protein